MLQHTSTPSTPRVPNRNGLGEPWDARRPKFRNVDLTKADPRLRVPNIEIVVPDGEEDDITAFVDVMILDSTGRDPYKGDVLVRGTRIVSVGDKLREADMNGARVINGEGRTLMSGMSERPTGTV